MIKNLIKKLCLDIGLRVTMSFTLICLAVLALIIPQTTILRLTNLGKKFETIDEEFCR